MIVPAYRHCLAIRRQVGRYPPVLHQAHPKPNPRFCCLFRKRLPDGDVSIAFLFVSRTIDCDQISHSCLRFLPAFPLWGERDATIVSWILHSRALPFNEPLPVNFCDTLCIPSLERWAHSASFSEGFKTPARKTRSSKAPSPDPLPLHLSRRLPLSPCIALSMNSDPLSSIVYLLSAVPTSPLHDQLDVTIYENGLATSSLLTTPVLSESDLSNAPLCPRLFVAIRSAPVHAAIRWQNLM